MGKQRILPSREFIESEICSIILSRNIDDFTFKDVGESIPHQAIEIEFEYCGFPIMIAMDFPTVEVFHPQKYRHLMAKKFLSLMREVEKIINVRIPRSE
jgi:hypothetical protein